MRIILKHLRTVFKLVWGGLRYARQMLVTTRFRGLDDLRQDLLALADLLQACAGCEQIAVGRNLDDQELWTLTSCWRDVGSYRRALGSYEVKLHGTPTLLRAIDEPSAYEIVRPGGELNHAQARVVDPGSIG